MEKYTEIITSSIDENIPESSYVIELFENKKFAELKEALGELHSADIAEILDELPDEYFAPIYRLIPKELSAEVFVEMDSDRQEHVINSFTDRELSVFLDELYLDDTVDIIEEMPAVVVKRIIKNSKAENRELINKLLKYPKDSAGSIMTTEYVRLRANINVGEAISQIRKVALDKETVYTCYITDAQRHLIGIVTAKDILIHSEDTLLSDIMEESVVFARTTENREDVALKFDKYGFLALPVVDGEDRLVGIITVDDAMEVIKTETDADFAKIAAVTPSEESYLKTSSISIWKARIPWLMLLMLSATFSSAILTKFESVLPTVLLIFVPMLMGTGGNGGTQVSVTVIRAISVGELKFKDIPRVVLKEFFVGVLCAVSLGVVAFGKVMLVDNLIMQNPAANIFVALAVGLAIGLTIMASKLVGCVLPLVAKKLGFDPAVMASPFITTIVDILSLILYFVVAQALL